MQCRPLVIKVPMLSHKPLSSGLLCWVKKTNLAGARMLVRPSIIGIGARTAGPNGTGEASFDAPERRKDYDGSFTVTSVV